MGTNYGPYVMYILSQLMQKRQEEEAGGAPPEVKPKETEGQAEQFFGLDETGADWHREANLELLKHFCREGYAQASRHGHFLIGNNQSGSFIGIPGRFLLEDQPAGGRTGFTLWQPLRGGEELYGGLDDMDEETARQVYGYWIAALDSRTLQISEV